MASGHGYSVSIQRKSGRCELDKSGEIISIGKSIFQLESYISYHALLWAVFDLQWKVDVHPAEKRRPAIQFLLQPKRIFSWKITKGLQINNNGR